MRNGSTRLGTINAYQGKVGAGGYTTGIDFANDGTAMVRTDTFNAYVLDPNGTTWQTQILPGINCNASDIDIFYGGDPHPWGQCGTYAARLAPSNSAVRYIVCMGKVWVTQNAGALYTPSPLASQAGCLPNQLSRTCGQPLAVDPQNPAVAVFGSPSTGVKITTDYGVNWTAISTSALPLPSAGARYSIAFDPSSAVSGGRKQGIYVYSPGNGLYRTTNAGSTWTAVPAPNVLPTAASHLNVDSAGRAWLTGSGGEDNGDVRIWSGTSWSYPNKSCKNVAFSPHIAGTVYATGPGGGLDISRDNGATWDLAGTNAANHTMGTTSIPWQFGYELYMANGGFAIDPVVNRLWYSTGVGAWRTGTPPTSLTFGSKVPVVEFSKGIENMVSQIVRCAPDGTVGYACHDRGSFVFAPATARTTFQGRYGVDSVYQAKTAPNETNFQHCQDIDWAPEDNAFWVATGFLDGRATGWTPDRGKTWNRVDTLISASGGTGGGQVAVLSKDIILQVQTNAVQPLAGNGAKNGVYLTTNRGASWSLLTIGDNNAIMGQRAYNDPRKVLIKDSLTPGRAYFFNVGDGSGSASDLACRGIWRIDVNLSTGAPTITRIKSSYITVFGGDYYGGKFTQLGADDWLYCGGDEGIGLWRSTDGMANWSKVTGTDDQNAGAEFGEVFGVAVGKAAAGSSFKTVLVAGWRMPVGASATNSTGYGFWMSTDGMATWKLYAKYPGGVFDSVQDMSGDPTRFGRFFIGWGGTGMGVLDYDYQLRAS